MSFFTFPWVLWLLLLMPLLSVLGWWCAYRKRKALSRLGDLFALQQAAHARGWRDRLRRFCTWLALVLLVVGAAGPRWGRDHAHETVSGRDIIAVLDLSRSMQAEPKSRRERAITALLHLCDTVEERGGHRLGLVVFAAHPEVACPLTNDYFHFRDVLNQLAENGAPVHIYPQSKSDVSGTRIGAALQLAAGLHDPGAEGAQDILLLSDGDDPVDDGEWRQGIAAAQVRGISVDVVGIGNPDKTWPVPTELGALHHEGQLVQSKLEEKRLQEITAQTRGTYIPLRTSQLPLGKLYQEVLAGRERLRDNDEGSLIVFRPRYAWFLAPALFLLAAPLLIGERRRGQPVQ